MIFNFLIFHSKYFIKSVYFRNRVFRIENQIIIFNEAILSPHEFLLWWRFCQIDDKKQVFHPKECMRRNNWWGLMDFIRQSISYSVQKCLRRKWRSSYFSFDLGHSFLEDWRQHLNKMISKQYEVYRTRNLMGEGEGRTFVWNIKRFK